ncbi:MAG TPA: hypothetical protein VIP77_08960 [Jiangellaceae bacterium]
MSVRRETIILELEDDASAEALSAAAALKTLDAAIDGVGGHANTANRRLATMTQRADKLAASMGKANAALGTTNTSLDSMGSRGLVRFSGQVDNASMSIDRFSGRAALLGTAIATIGPAAIPLTAAAIPAITTLTAGMGAAAGAAGVLMLAFNGVGEAVTAVSDYRLAPTAENLAKVREEMDRLGPSGASFVMAIDEATPALEDLQRTARDGIFPGFERGLDTLMTQLPGVRDLVADLSLTVGTLGETSADALANDADWQEFFEHIGTDGASALDAFGRAAGNVVAGGANLIEALAGITGDSSGLVDSSRAFREWADNLEHTEGFKEFADYVRESGPQVTEFLSSAGRAMVALAEAAAPWGQVVLPALTAVADIFTAIASSPVGPALFTAATAMLAFSKASSLTASAMGRMGLGAGGAAAGGGGMFTALGTHAASARGSVSTLTRDVRSMGREFERLGTTKSTALSFMSGTSAAAQRTRASVGAMAAGAAKAGPAVAAIGLLASGNAEKMDVQNAAMLGLAGSMVGPWGAAAGAAVGFTMDLAAANDDLTAAIKNANLAMDSGSIEVMGASVKELQATLRESSDADIWGFGGGKVAEVANVIAPLTNIKKLMGGLSGEGDKAAKKLEEIADTKTGFEDLAVALGANKDSSVEMASGADRAQMAMEKLGISHKAFLAAQREGGSAWSEMQAKIAAYVAQADTAAGRTAAFGDALANMGNDALGAAHNASQLTAAFSAILDPAQGLIAAQDGMTSTLHGLAGQLDATNKSLTGNSDAAIKNRAAISAGVDGIQNLNAAQAEANVSTNEMALTLNEQRQALIDSGVAAGLSRGQVERIVNQMGLTPDVVRTAFEAAGIDGVNAKTQGLINRYRTLPPKLQTHIQANGIPETMGQVNALVKKYNLTEKQRQALISLKDNATPGLNRIISTIGRVRGKTVQVKVDPGTSISTVNAVQAVINSLSGKTVTVTTLQRTIYAAGKMDSIAKAQGKADGGEILGQRYPYGDKVLIHAAPGEEIISNRHGQADAFRRDRAAGRIPAYADGGTITLPGYATGGTVRGSGVGGSRSLETWAKMWDRAAKTTQRALDDHKKQLQRATDRLDYWNQKRDALRSEVSGSLTRNWFEGGSTDPWSGGLQGGTVAYANQQWKQQGADATRLPKVIANLQKNGAGDAFIAEILRSPDPLAAAEMFNKQTKAGMRHSQSLYLSATRATASAASYTSGVVYGDEIASSRKQVEHIRGDIHHLTALLKRQHKEAEASKKKYSAAKAASKGKRSQKR